MVWVNHATHWSFLLAVVVVAFSLAVVNNSLSLKRVLPADHFGCQAHVPFIDHDVLVSPTVRIASCNVSVLVVIIHQSVGSIS